MKTIRRCRLVIVLATYLLTALAGSALAFTELSASPLFAAAFLSFDTGNGAFAVAIGDLNADGKPDLAVANVTSNTVSVLLGNGDGTFGSKTDFGTGSYPVSVAIGGRHVATVVNEAQAAGWRSVFWDGRDERGREAPSGIFFARLESGGNVRGTKIVIAR